MVDLAETPKFVHADLCLNVTKSSAAGAPPWGACNAHLDPSVIQGRGGESDRMGAGIGADVL